MPSTNKLLKLTSVQVVTLIREEFEQMTKCNKMSMAKFLNRAMLLYTKDEEFKAKIDSYTGVIPYHKEF